MPKTGHSGGQLPGCRVPDDLGDANAPSFPKIERPSLAHHVNTLRSEEDETQSPLVARMEERVA